MESVGLPGLCIYTQNEDVSIDAMGATRTVGRDLELIVEGYATGSNLDDTLDQIGKEVEPTLAGEGERVTKSKNKEKNVSYKA